MENTNNSASSVSQALKSNEFQFKKSNSCAFHGEASGQRSDVLSAVPWISPKVGAQSCVTSHEVAQKVSDMSQSQLLKDQHANWEVSQGLSSDPTRSFSMNIQPSDILERDRTTTAIKWLPQLPSEDIFLYYKDPNGEIQGPVSSSDLIRWFEAGFFGIDLEVRLIGAACDSPFLSLRDAIPQLRAKHRSPPGFSIPKQSEAAEMLSGSNFSDLEKVRAGSSGTNISWNGPGNKQESSCEAVSKMLESLISGLQGYTENNSFKNLLEGVEKGCEQNLAQKFLLKQEQELQSSRAASSFSQNVDLVSILQGLYPDFYKRTTDLSSSSGQGGFSTSQHLMNSYDNRHFNYQPVCGIQEQMLQSQHRSFANTVGQFINRSHSLPVTENLQLLLGQQRKILQLLEQLVLQQQLLGQHEQNKYSQVLQSTTPIGESSSEHLHAVEIPPDSVPIDNIGLQVPHKMMQTNSCVPALALQHASTVGFASLPSQIPTDVVSASDPLSNLSQVQHEMLQTNSEMLAHTLEVTHSSGFATLSSGVLEDVDYSVGSEAIVPLLPHQFFENTYREGWDATLSEQLGYIQNKDSMSSSADILEESSNLKEQFDSDILLGAPENVSSLNLQPVMMNANSSVDGVDYNEGNEPKWSPKKSERGKAVEMNTITAGALTNVSVSCPIKKDAELHQKQEIVLAFPSDPNLGDFVHWKSGPGFHEASAPSNFSVEDDMSWGPLDQSNQDVIETGIPSFGNFSSRVTKPVKGSLARVNNRKKSSSSKPCVNIHSSTRAATQSTQKGRKGNIDKHSEAMGFRLWCESEMLRLTGSKDTTILEFCLKQPTSEAEMLLIDNLASNDQDHMFIDTFLNHKELLTADVLEIAFQPHNDQGISGLSSGDIDGGAMAIPHVDHFVLASNEGSKGGWEKKVRKGRR